MKMNRVFICEWCHQGFTRKRMPTGRYRGQNPRFCDKSCSAKWRMSDTEYVQSLVTDRSRQVCRENMLEIRGRPEVQVKLAEHNASPEWARARAIGQQRGHETLRRQGYIHLNGGNGTGLTVPQRILMERLEWEAEYILPVGKRELGGLPTHYKIDIADPQSKIAIEVDGASHRTPTVRARDCKKTEYLQSQGWVVLRFSNKEILTNTEQVVAQIREVLMSITSRQEQRITLPTDC